MWVWPGENDSPNSELKFCNTYFCVGSRRICTTDYICIISGYGRRNLPITFRTPQALPQITLINSPNFELCGDVTVTERERDSARARLVDLVGEILGAITPLFEVSYDVIMMMSTCRIVKYVTHCVTSTARSRKPDTCRHADTPTKSTGLVLRQSRDKRFSVFTSMRSRSKMIPQQHSWSHVSS